MGVHLGFLTSHPGQLSILPSVGRKISTGQNAPMLCDMGVKADGSFHLWINRSEKKSKKIWSEYHTLD